MFWKKKKQPVEFKVKQDVWLRLLLSDYNLLDVNGLLAIMNISIEKAEQELAKEVLSYFQPKILEEIKKGNNEVREYCLNKDKFYKIFPSYNDNSHSYLNSKLNKFGYSFGVCRSLTENNEVFFNISFCMFRPIPIFIMEK